MSTDLRQARSRPEAIASPLGSGPSNGSTPPDISPRSSRPAADWSPGGGSATTTAAAALADGVPLPRSDRTETCVKVVVRFRPPVDDVEHQDTTAFTVHPNGQAVESVDGSYRVELDRAFGEASTQEAVYDYIGRPIVDAVLGGYNGTIFAYGHTGSGKTYSMMGPNTQDSQQGIVPRAAQQIFDRIAGAGPEVVDAFPDDTEFTLRCSFLEVYREQMRDLLSPANQKLQVKELPQRGLWVDGLSREYVTCKAEVLSILRAGSRARSVARTRLNQHSSRSHAIFVLHVEQRSTGADGATTERLGKLTLVDLAGSEKVSKSECVGETLEEAKKINWSLSALGKVIDSLAEQRPHVPYRDSRLTRVLQEALGGNCRTTLLVAASSCTQHFDETLSSLRFAARTQKVRNHAQVNYMCTADQLLLLVGRLQRELSSAKKQILHLANSAQADHRRGGLDESLGKGARGEAMAARSTRRSLKRPTNAAPPNSAPAPVTASTETSSTVGSASLGSVLGSASGMKLASSGSFPGLGLSFGVRSSSGGDEDDQTRKQLLNMSLTGKEDDEVSRTSSRDRAADEAWRPLALAARDALWSLEAALVAQERSLEQAGLLGEGGASSRPSRYTPQAARAKDPRGDHVQKGNSDIISERCRALRHAVDARGLQWRLQLERHRTESLSLELEMRRRYSEELERSLEESTVRLHEALQNAGSASLGDSMRCPPILRRGGNTCSGGAEAAGGHSPSCSGVAVGPRHPRIKRPVPRGAGAHMAATVSSSSRAACTGAIAATAGARASAAADVRGVLEASAAASLASICSVSEGSPTSRGTTLTTFGAEELWPRVAGTGDSGDASGGLPERAEFEAMSRAARAQLEAPLERLQGELARRDAQVVELVAELGARDVKLSALRHEVLVKDALLKKLSQDTVLRAESCDDTLERLVEQVIDPLSSVLTHEQMGVATALGERSLTAAEKRWPRMSKLRH